jgi:hypothetical protein
MAYSGGILTLDQLEAALLRRVLPYRPMEKRLGASYVRQWGAAMADCFPSSLVVAWTEDGMRSSGRRAQARECRRRLEAGGLPDETAAALTARLEQLVPNQRRATLACEAAGGGAGRWWTPLRLALAFLTAWLALLHFAACAGPSDLTKATLGHPAHLPAAELALATTRELSGRTALVTGATSGVGLETAGALAAAGFHVLIGGRDAAAAEAAAAAVTARALKRGRGGSGRALLLDLSDLASVARAARSVGGRALHVLVCCAGVMPSPLGAAPSLTANGVESVWGVNHLGHFAFAYDAGARTRTLLHVCTSGASHPKLHMPLASGLAI